MENIKKILVVDDEPALRDMIQLRAENMGYSVETAQNGAEALAKVRAGKFDLIISDVLMPVMDGFTFYKELKKTPATAAIPVLILTARGKMEDTFKVVGADDFVAKPFDGKILMEKVNLLLGGARSVQVEEPLSAPQPGSVKAHLSSDRKIFVAGTDREAVEAIATHMQQQGCRVETALSGRETLSRAMDFIPSVLILDVLMEDIESSQIIKALRATDELSNAGIITYCFYRVADIGSEDIRQMSLKIDAASERCLDEGALEYLGRFNDGPFLRDLQKFV